MARPPKKTPRKLQLGPWLRRLGRKQVDVAKAAGVGESYISSLIKGDKIGPTPEVLLDISEYLEITVNDLYTLPPSPESFKAIQAIAPAQQALLAQALEKLAPRKSKR